MNTVKKTKSDSHVCFEFVKPFCTCGKELSARYYELTAQKSFEETMRDIIDQYDMFTAVTTIFQQSKDDMFKTNINNAEQKTRLKFCCNLALKFGRSHPLSLEDSRVGVRKDQPPVSLPGALNRRKAIYWSS